MPSIENAPTVTNLLEFPLLEECRSVRLSSVELLMAIDPILTVDAELFSKSSNVNIDH